MIFPRCWNSCCLWMTWTHRIFAQNWLELSNLNRDKNKNQLIKIKWRKDDRAERKRDSRYDWKKTHPKGFSALNTRPLMSERISLCWFLLFLHYVKNEIFAVVRFFLLDIRMIISAFRSARDREERREKRDKRRETRKKKERTETRKSI